MFEEKKQQLLWLQNNVFGPRTSPFLTPVLGDNKRTVCAILLFHADHICEVYLRYSMLAALDLSTSRRGSELH